VRSFVPDRAASSRRTLPRSSEASNGREACELARRLEADIMHMELAKSEVDSQAATKSTTTELVGDYLAIWRLGPLLLRIKAIRESR
jgi:hypothetical protein